MRETVKLNNGVEMPRVGYDVFRIPEDETKKVVSEEISVTSQCHLIFRKRHFQVSN